MLLKGDSSGNHLVKNSDTIGEGLNEVIDCGLE